MQITGLEVCREYAEQKTLNEGCYKAAVDILHWFQSALHRGKTVPSCSITG